MKPIPLEDPKPISKGVIYLTLFCIFLSGCVLWYFFIPVEKDTLIFWLGLILILLPIWVAIEGLGEIVFSDKLGKKMTSGMRIIYGVVVTIILLFVINLGDSIFIAVFGIH